MLRLCSLLICSFLIISCGGRKESEESSFKSIKIDLDEAQTLKASEHFKLKDAIFFSDSLVVDNLMKVAVHDEYLVLHCGWGLDYLLIKDMVSGEEIVISAKGEGPNQYQKLTNFFINADGQIELLDGQSGKIMTYSLNGELKSVYQNKQLQGVSSLLSLNGEDYFLYGGNFYAPKHGFQLLVWNKNRDEILNSYFPFDKKKAGFMLFMEVRNFMKEPATFFQTYNP
ncbi:6-bladed beta-propeller, partial [Marivirga sp.]|uniref:6-bladed beta-propeller n=1 Tax=Marivirga sp. TaxID=2018662 RepID=UPI0025E75B7C